MQKRNLTRILSIFIFFLAGNVVAEASDKYLEDVRGILQQIIDVNKNYKGAFNTKVSEQMLKEQQPSTTSVLCSDSRVDTEAIHDSPVGNMFVIRNIGNQVETAYGSVEYGVYHLHTHILLIVGHSRCGAIKAALTDYSGESDRIRSELDNLVVDKHQSLNYNIIHNINNQVTNAMNDFKDKVKSGDVVVIGMVYDLHNDYNMGNGQLLIVNINNETDPTKLADNKYLQGLTRVKILGAATDSNAGKAKP